MNELDVMMAKAQIRFGYCVLLLLAAATAGVMFCMFWPRAINQPLLTLFVQAITGILGLAGSVGAFLYARHRAPTSTDEDPSKIVSKETTSTVVSQSVPLVPTEKPK
jgi:hypothetical protein